MIDIEDDIAAIKMISNSAYLIPVLKFKVNASKVIST